MTDKTTELLQKLQNGEISLGDCQQELRKSEKSNSEVTYKISPKSGCICFYGLRRMPISMYKQELVKILDTILDPEYQFNEEFKAFLTDNDAKLTCKK